MALTLPRASAADAWYEHYAAAEKALAQENWSRAIEELNNALEKKGDPGARARTYGMKFTAYFPYLELGIAYYHLGQLDAALQAFDTEERLGAIAADEPQLETLASYRQRVLEAQREQREAEQQRIDAIAAESLDEASRLEGESRFAEAMAALGNGLAVEPESPALLAAMGRLRRAVAEREARAELAERVAALVGRGRDLLARGRPAEASSVLRQALSVAGEAGSDEATTLLAQAQDALLRQVTTETADRGRAIESGVQAARRLHAEGRRDAALDRLQSVLALDPANPDALALQESLLSDRLAADQLERERTRRTNVDGLLAAAKTALDAGRHEEALGLANRVLALDSGNAIALEQLARAYRAVSQRLLGRAPRQNFPPAIRFVDLREEQADGAMAQRVNEPKFQLGGVIIDDSAVEVSLYAGDAAVAEKVLTDQSIGDLHVTEFRLSHELPAGPSIFRLVATDAAGQSSSSEYTVIYERPLSRSPWLYATLGALLAALAALAWSRRRRRLKRLRERRFNPYLAGAPVLDEKLFFGRQQLLDRILQTLHNNSLLLHGERRIGKTTLQHQLKRRLEELDDPGYQFYPVFIDLQGIRQERFFATLAEETLQELGPVLDGFEPSTPLSGEYGYRNLVADLREILKTLRRRTDKRVRLVLLIDEGDELNSFDPRINQRLRSLFMKSFAEDLIAVVSGVSIKREWDREGSPWYNFFEEIDVGPFRREDARELIEEPIRGLFRLEAGATERVLELAECRPYRIQKLCMKLVNRMYEQGRREITTEDVEAVGDSMSQGAS